MRDHDYGARFLLKKNRKPIGRPRENFFFRYGVEIALALLALTGIYCAVFNGVSAPCR